MNKIFKFSLLVIINFSFFTLYGQSNYNNTHILEGKVLDDSTNKSVPNVNIYNESKRDWNSANVNGYFNIWVDIGDTLLFSAVGYLYEVIIINDTLVNKEIIIKLKPTNYEIREVTVRSIKRYSIFKQDVLNLKLQQTKLDSVSNEINTLNKKIVFKSDEERKIKEIFNREKGTLFEITYPLVSKQAREKKKLKKVYKLNKQQDLINKKFNYDIVKIYTNLNDNKITEFMIFCAFSEEFIINASEYEIGEKILEKLNEYKSKQ